jgi:hypothetical protein
MEGRDATSVLNYMKVMTEKDTECFFKYNVDSECRLKFLIWLDSQSQMDYGAFGDIVIFDSTYRVNRYNLPFVPFIGVNHHRGTVVFVCGIILDETVGSYVWLLQAFLEAIHQKYPISIITDGDLAMAKAIEVVMPNTDHRLCSWHVEQNMVHHLPGKTLQDFRKFIYHPMDVEEFERWVEFMYEHKINDMWLLRMYELKNKWSAAYTRGRTFLGMQSNQRSESLNSRLYSHLNRRMSLVDLVEHYEFCLLHICRKVIELDAIALGSIPFHDPGANPFEKEAAHIFTIEIFVRIREQIRGIAKWEVSGVVWNKDHRIRYELSSLGEGEQRQVYVSCRVEHSLITDARCKCRMLESQLIPCAHIFTVLRNIRTESIPPCCVMQRWTVRATNAFPPERLVSMHVCTEEMQHFRNLSNKANDALFKASRSVECSDRVMQLFDELLAEDGYENHSTSDTFVGPLPPHYSGANSESLNDVLNPNKIIAKGAPPRNKRLKRFHDYLRRR